MGSPRNLVKKTTKLNHKLLQYTVVTRTFKKHPYINNLQ